MSNEGGEGIGRRVFRAGFHAYLAALAIWAVLAFAVGVSVSEHPGGDANMLLEIAAVLFAFILTWLVSSFRLEMEESAIVYKAPLSSNRANVEDLAGFRSAVDEAGVSSDLRPTFQFELWFKTKTGRDRLVLSAWIFRSEAIRCLENYLLQHGVRRLK